MDVNQIRLIEHNTAVVANVLNVVTLAIGQVAGKQVQRKLDQETVSDEALTSLVAARLKNTLKL
jgi:hypothetical protein